MLHSRLFVKSKKELPEDEVSKNAILLHKASFVYKEMSGVYTFLPMGLRVLNKIENLLRKHMDLVGTEIYLSSLAPKELWQQTGRINEVDVLFKVSAANENSKNKSNNEYILNSTHEELVTPIAAHFAQSYKDFPVDHPLAFYQIQTKFRNEPRAKSGLLRGREFRMKDLYSFHLTKDDFEKYYESVKQSYINFFTDLQLGQDLYITSASGGDFTEQVSHEFQIMCDAGEDTIYIDEASKNAFNKELVSTENEIKFGVKFDALEQVTACEVGNIFTLEDKFTKAFNLQYTNRDNKKELVPHMGCYGIGTTRIMGVMVEKFSDDSGMVWPKVVAPFDVEIVSLFKELGDDVYVESKSIYEKLKASYDCLLDDREISVGQKLNDADLYGIPVQIIVGAKNLERGVVEVKVRKSGRILEVQLNEVESLLKTLWPEVF